MSTSAENSESINPVMINTVKLNVGGSNYEVAQSLLDQYPDSMFSKIASDTWAMEKRQNLSSLREMGSTFSLCWTTCEMLALAFH